MDAYKVIEHLRKDDETIQTGRIDQLEENLGGGFEINGRVETRAHQVEYVDVPRARGLHDARPGNGRVGIAQAGGQQADSRARPARAR